MNRDTASCHSRDILSNPLLAGLVFWLPIIAIVVTGYLDVGNGWRTGVWTAALAIMGSACVANAIRCGRVHCYMTGPFFLVMAVCTLFYGLGLVSLGRNGWGFIGLVLLVGVLVFCCLPEVFLGKYRWRGGARDP